MAGGKGKKGNGAMKKIKGRGDYEVSRPSSAPAGILGKLDKVLSRLPKGSFAAGGAALGARIGGARGAQMGQRMGAGLSAISGYGDYTVKSNSLGKVSTSSDMVPQFVKNDHSVRVVHREFIKDIVVPAIPAQFTNSEFTINPGNAVLFPWLARMAKQYSQYKIHGMVFVYKTMTSDYAASGPLGTVIIATNYNAIDRAFTSKIEMENSEFAVSCKPSQSLIHAIECDPSVSGETTLYIRDPAYETTDTSDKRFYDFGKLQVATTGLPIGAGPGAVLGEFWVSYDIEFMKPIIGGDTTVSPCPAIIGQFDGSVGVVAASNPSGRIPKVVLTKTFVPAINTQYSIGINELDAFTVTGDTALFSPGGVVYLDQNTLTLAKNGRYILTFRFLGTTTLANYTLANSTAAQPSNAATIANVGSANGIITSNRGKVAWAVLSTASINGYDNVIVIEANVSGIPDGTGFNNYCNLTPQLFTSNAGSLIGSVTHTVSVEWLSVGLNGQSLGYTNPAFP